MAKVEIDTQAAYLQVQALVASRLREQVGPELVRLAKSMAPVSKTEPRQKGRASARKPLELEIVSKPKWSETTHDARGRPVASVNPDWSPEGQKQRELLQKGRVAPTPTVRTVMPFRYRLASKDKGRPVLSEVKGRMRRWQGINFDLGEEGTDEPNAARAPRITIGGRLRNSIRQEPIRYDGKKVVLTVRAYAPYARWVEFVRNWRPQKKHTPFLLPAHQSVKKRYKKLMRG